MNTGRTAGGAEPRGARDAAAAAPRITRDALRSAGLRVTPQRVAVLDALSDAGGSHMSADDVWQRLCAAGSTMDRSTAYRVLADLSDADLLTQVRFEDGVARFEVQGVAHHHAVCVVCGATEDVPADVVTPLGAALVRRLGFRVALGEPLMVRGTCRACSAQASTRTR